MFALAADGQDEPQGHAEPAAPRRDRATRTSTPSSLPFPPALVQRLGLMAGAPLGRLFGYEATYTPAPATAVPAAV